MASKKPKYGIDAPGVVRNLAVVAAIGSIVWAISVLDIVQDHFAFAIGNANIGISLKSFGLTVAVPCAVMALWMLWDSKVGKVRRREVLLKMLPWTGKEMVLDVGCGRGLMMIGAAKRLTTGEATGIDIWQAQDLSGNCAEAVLENARREGVADRVKVCTSDMRQMPFEANSFDVIVSRAAIHNLYDVADRVKAMSEIGRVLKPGGWLLLEDIRHGQEYAASLTSNGFVAIRRTGSKLSSWVARKLSRGALDPVTLVARKRDAWPVGG